MLSDIFKQKKYFTHLEERFFRAREPVQFGSTLARDGYFLDVKKKGCENQSKLVLLYQGTDIFYMFKKDCEAESVKFDSSLWVFRDIDDKLKLIMK